MLAAIIVVVAYLIGGIPTAYIAGRLKGVDITKHGSGNVGGTNAVRVLGAKWGIPVGLVDILKGSLVVLASRKLGIAEHWQLSAALAAVLGHNWSPYIRFRGGKGIATTIGVSIVLFPQALVVALLAAVAVVLLTRYVSLGSMLLVTLLCINLIVLRESTQRIGLAAILALIAIYRHRSNIQRLIKGEELRM